jgi:hypothetical protein
MSGIVLQNIYWLILTGYLKATLIHLIIQENHHTPIAIEGNHKRRMALVYLISTDSQQETVVITIHSQLIVALGNESNVARGIITDSNCIASMTLGKRRYVVVSHT